MGAAQDNLSLLCPVPVLNRKGINRRRRFEACFTFAGEKRMVLPDIQTWLKRLAVITFSLIASTAWAGNNGKLSRELQNSTTTQDVIVQFVSTADAATLKS